MSEKNLDRLIDFAIIAIMAFCVVFVFVGSSHLMEKIEEPRKKDSTLMSGIVSSVKSVENTLCLDGECDTETTYSFWLSGDDYHEHLVSWKTWEAIEIGQEVTLYASCSPYAGGTPIWDLDPKVRNWEDCEN